jgi:hypothetical protein
MNIIHDSWYSFLLRGWVDPRAIVRLEGLGQLKKSTLSGTRTGDLPACSIVPQPTTLPGVKSGRRVGLTTLPPSVSRMSENVGTSTSRKPKGLHGLYRDNFTFTFYCTIHESHRITGFLDFFHRPVFWKIENTTFRKLDLFSSLG